jgi:RNA polymerase sigma-32 factor
LKREVPKPNILPSKSSDAGETEREEVLEDEDSEATDGPEEVVPEATAVLDFDDDAGEKEPAARDDLGEGEGDDSDARAPESARTLAPYDAMAAYMREVQRHPLLSAEETRSLAERFVETQDPKAAARLVTANLRLVVKIAYEYRRAYKNMMDLVQEGNIGLMQAVKRYDPYRGVKLSSYSAWWIRAYILRFILNNWRLVKLGTTQSQRKLFFNLRKKRDELIALGIDPTYSEIAKQLNVPEADVAEMDVRLSSNERSLDAPVGDAHGRATSRIDTMPSHEESPDMRLAGEELQALLREKLAAFRTSLAGRDKEMAIFDDRLVAEDPLTLQELGDRLGVSRERVRQLEQRVTTRLREYLKNEIHDVTELT